MKTVKSFDGLQELMYSGQLENKQFPMESVVDYTILTQGQQKLFKHVMVGLELYTPQELYAMNSSKKAKIFKRHKQAQMMLNLWKQELTNVFTNNLLGSLFPKSELIQNFTADYSTSKNFINTLSFKELGITKPMLINKLIQENFLPRNFATI
jgi:hypothetical protein